MRFQKRLFASRFFTVSVLLHFIFVFAFGGTVLYKTYSEPPDFSAGDSGGIVGGEDVSAPPPPKPLDQPAFKVTVPTTNNNPVMNAITTTAVGQVKFSMPQIQAPVAAPPADLVKAAPTPPPLNPNIMNKVQAQQIREMTSSWSKPTKGGGIGSSTVERAFEFTVYLAKYSGGDWGSTHQVRRDAATGRDIITVGSLPNLLYFMNRQSRGKIAALPNPVPLDLASSEIFAKKPPFILFTGHRDFVLTQQEVDNLQKYVRMGGCIWGDSSLAGRRSRFDIAFRREMRRVIPDKDKDWEALPVNHGLFTRSVYYPEIKEPPAGLNFYREPVYALKYIGEVAIIYTANNYNGMWQIALNDKLQIDTTRDVDYRMINTNERMLDRADTYFRNCANPVSLLNSYKFGTNIVIHLLTRWEDKLKAVPAGL